METAGARLKKIRLEKGLSLEEVHKKTKVHLNILKAIEEDSLVNLSSVYLKGFLKIYCKFLRVNPADFIKDYREPISPPKIKTEFQRAGRTESLAKTISLKLNSVRPRITLRRAVIFLVVIIFMVLLFKLPAAIRSFQTRLSLKAKTTQAPSVAKTEKNAPAALIPKNQPVTLVRLGLKVKENCLVKVKADGRLVMERTFRKGMSDSWTAKEKIELSLGNAAAAELEVNGRHIGAIGRRGQSIKNILITKDGLVIPR